MALTVHHAEPLKIDGPKPAKFSLSMNREQATEWAMAIPVWSRFVNFKPNTIIVCRSSKMIGGGEAEAVGLPLCVYACDGGEYDCPNHLHIFVNEDGTRGALLTANPVLDEEAVALAIIRRDQGYGPAAE